MAFLFLDQDAQDDVVVKAMRDREEEWHNYEVNRLNYLTMLDSMEDVPEVWPDNYVRYKNVFGEKLTELLQDADYDTVVALQHRDRVRALLATTTAEQGKCLQVYEALSKQIPRLDRLAAAVTRVRDEKKA